jgi:hypothetical protein
MRRPPRLKPKIILTLGALLVVVALAVFFYANLRPSPIRIQATFTGFTNLDITYTTRSGTFPVTLAYFCVSNAGKGSVVENGIFGYATKSKGAYLSDNSLMSELKPGQFKTISLTTPWNNRELTTPWNNREPWRAILCFSKADWRYRLSQKPPWVLDMIRPLVSERWLMGYHPVEVYSDWVNGPEFVPATTNTVKTLPE